MLASRSAFTLSRDLSPVDPVIVTDPALHLTWLDLADTALVGRPHSSPCGTSTSWLSWHWPGLALGLLGWFSRAVVRALRRRRGRLVGGPAVG